MLTALLRLSVKQLRCIAVSKSNLSNSMFIHLIAFLTYIYTPLCCSFAHKNESCDTKGIAAFALFLYFKRLVAQGVVTLWFKSLKTTFAYLAKETFSMISVPCGTGNIPSETGSHWYGSIE